MGCHCIWFILVRLAVWPGPYFDPLSERNMCSVWKILNGLLQGRSKPIVGLRGMHACMRSDGHEP